MNTIDSIRAIRSAEVINSVRCDVKRMRGEGRVKRAWLIGSFAVNAWDATSDIDLIVESNGEVSYKDFALGSSMEMDIVVLGPGVFERRMQDRLFAKTVNKWIEL